MTHCHCVGTGLPSSYMLGLHPQTHAPITFGMGARGPYLLMVSEPSSSQSDSGPEGQIGSQQARSVKRLQISLEEAGALTFDRHATRRA